jgi:hypothetical protein
VIYIILVKESVLNRILISFLTVSWIAAFPVRAFASCAIVNDALVILSEVRQFQNETSASIKTRKLDLSSLLTPDFIKAHPSEAERVATFAKTVNETDDLSRVSFLESDTQNYLDALQIMERFWNCIEPEEISPVEVFGQSGSMTTIKEVDVVNETDRIAPEKAVSGQSDNRALSQNSGELRPARIAKPNELQVNYMILIGMIILFVGGMVYVVRKRPKPREERRIINVPARVELQRHIIEMCIVDITAHGCKIEHAERIHGQKRLRVELDGIWYSGQVKWHNSAFAGVKFRRPMTELAFNRVVKATFV